MYHEGFLDSSRRDRYLTAVLSLDLDVTYLFVLALFLVPLLILNGLVFGPFLKLFEERHEQLEGALVRAEAMLSEAEHRAKAFEERIGVATVRGIDARNRIRTQAADEMAARIQAERKKLGERVEVALTEVHAKRREALANAHVEASKFAELMAAKLLGRGV
jgi:F0F1-type ATP synthase membrane subunit b/b'